MSSRSIFIIIYLVFSAPALCAQSSQPPDVEEQNETMLDTLKKMQIKREEQEHKKTLDKGTLIKEDATNLAKDVFGNRLPRTAEKRLREIEKSAKQIRSDFGGSSSGDDDPLENPPANLLDAIKRLNDTSERLNKELSKTSRRVISVAVIEIATEIAQLSKYIRGYLF